MSFPGSFGSQLAAIMDVLAKAAVAEITKLVEDGGLVLRKEICRRDGEIQELRRSLKVMEEELCKAQEAILHKDKVDRETNTMYFEQRSADSLWQPPDGANESLNIRLVVKPEPTDEAAAMETKDDTATAADFGAAPEDPLWAASVAMPQHVQMFSSHAEQYPAPATADGSFDPQAITAQEIIADCLSVPVKLEAEGSSACMEGITPESAQSEQFRHVSHPQYSQDKCLQSALQQAGPSPAMPHEQRPALSLHTEDYRHHRNILRAKRPTNVWRSSHKLFMCSVCNKGFLRLSQLEEHKASHQAVKPFRCLECGKSFTQKTRLKTHQSVHTGERPFSCKICGKMFSRQDNCLRHERFHSGTKPYSCKQCGKSFTVQGNLKIHQEIHLQGY
ncbi:zinc finger protein 571-like [Salarias fasciatus]|uniref:Zinc finger protein 571-like n=1 Tax=Salarias fasciatus TaxID=181472 RepID=A0A672JS86_SALFA|nr:zinc finger protein 571-like [Salarias fasciatus]